MSCHSTTRAQEDPYAFTESAPLQANSLAYANHSSAVSNSSSSSSNNNATTTTTTTIQTASSGASLLLTTNSAGNVTASKDKTVTISPSTVTSPATLKVRYNGVVTTASPTGTAVVRAAVPAGTTIPVFTKPVQIKQPAQQQGNLSVQPSPTVTVGKLIKKVLPHQKAPMITTVVAGGAKIISRLQQPNQSTPVQQLSTTGGSILKFIKIPPQQLAKGAVAGGATLPQGSFIHVTTSSDGARKLLVTNSSSSNGVNPTISVATSSARIANAGTATVSRNAAGVAVVSNVSTVSPTKIRLIQPQAQGKFYLQTTNSNTIGTTAHLSNPVTIATLRNTLIKQHQLQQQQLQQQQQQSPTQQKQPQPTAQPQQQQQILQQKPSQQHTVPPSPKPQQITPQSVQQQQQKQPQQQQQQPLQKQQKPQQIKQQPTVGNQVSPQQKTSPQHQPTQSLQKLENADGTQKLLPKPQLQTCSVQSQSQQQPQAVPKTLLQSTTNGQKQSLLIQQQQPPPPKQATSPTVQGATPPAKNQQPQSLLLQPQRKQQQPGATTGNKQRAQQPQQQSAKPVTSNAPISLLTTSSVNATKDGSLLAKVNESARMCTVSPKEENASKMTEPTESVRRPANQQSLLLVGSNVEVPKSHDQTSSVMNRVEKPTPVEPTVSSVVVKKPPTADVASPSAPMVSERIATEDSVPQETKPIPTIKEEELTPPENVNGKVRAMSGRKSAATTGKSAGKQQQKSTKRTHSQHLLAEEQEQLHGRASPPAGGNIGTLPSCTTSTPNAPGRNNPQSPSTSLLLSNVKQEKEFEIKQEVVEQDEKPPKQRLVALGAVPGAIVVPIKRPKVKEWHAPGAYLFDLKDPGDESDDDAYDEYPNTLSCWYEESIEITVPESSSTASCWGLNSMHRNSATSSRGGKGKGNSSKSANNAKFEIRMLSRDERLELKKAYLQRRVVQCRNGLRMRSAAASTAKKRLESMAKMVAKLDKRRQIELNKTSEKATCTSEGCNKSALVMTSHCYDHITEDADQCLFQRCTAKFSDNSQCRVPVFDISHELILCKEHAWKHDNHDKMSQEVKMHKKPAAANVSMASVTPPAIIAGRKKAKPPPTIQPPPQVVVRSQKRPRKKKKLTPLQQQMLLHQQQYKQQFSIHHHNHQSSQGAYQQQQGKQLTVTPPANQPQRKVVLQQAQPQKSLLNPSSINGKVQVQIKQPMMPLQKASLIAHPGQQQHQQQPQRLHLIDGSENPPKTTATFSSGALHTAVQANRTLHIPNRSISSGFTGTTLIRGQHNTSTMEIVDQLEHDHHDQQQKQHQQQLYSNGTHTVQSTMHNTSPANTQELLTICENSSAYASSEDTGVGGLSESELLATQDVIEEIIPFEFSNLLHPNMLSHLPPDELHDLLGLDDVPAEDDTGDSHQSCPREVEDDIERALEHVKSLDDMTVEPSSLLGDFLDNVDDEMLDGSDMCATTEQMLQSTQKATDIRGMVHT